MEICPVAEEPEQFVLVLGACRRLLRPIVRVMLRHGVVYRQFSDLLKEVYVEVATSDYGLRGRPTNVSRTALLTGLDRKEVRRLRQANDASSDSSGDHGRAYRRDQVSRVLTAWFQDEAFSFSGEPIELGVESADDTPSFTTLCDRYAGDVPATTLLKELKNAGAVVEDDHGKLRPLTRYYMPARANMAALDRAGSVLEDLGNTVAHNLARAETSAPRFERRATNLCVDVRALNAFRRYVERVGQQFLESIDSWLSAHEAPTERAEQQVRLGLGVYWIEDAKK
jgi:hypothetical protein